MKKWKELQDGQIETADNPRLFDLKCIIQSFNNLFHFSIMLGFKEISIPRKRLRKDDDTGLL